MTNAAYLALVEDAITSLMTANVQSYQLNNRQVTKLDLKELVELRERLKIAVSRDTYGGFYVAQNREPE